MRRTLHKRLSRLETRASLRRSLVDRPGLLCGLTPAQVSQLLREVDGATRGLPSEYEARRRLP